MASTLFSSMSNAQQAQPNMQNMIQGFNQFKAQFKGNPEQVFYNLVRQKGLGREQLTQISKMAENLMKSMQG